MASITATTTTTRLGRDSNDDKDFEVRVAEVNVIFRAHSSGDAERVKLKFGVKEIVSDRENRFEGQFNRVSRHQFKKREGINPLLESLLCGFS